MYAPFDAIMVGQAFYFHENYSESDALQKW